MKYLNSYRIKLHNIKTYCLGKYMQINKIKLHIDSKGFLVHFEDWNEEIAMYIAALEGFALHTIHWDIIYFTRTFYTEFNTLPKIRILINIILLKYGKEKGTSRYLAKLFPNGAAAQQISKIAGLPKPITCL